MFRPLGIALTVVCSVACGGKTGVSRTDYAGPIALSLVNQTPRTIEQIFIFPRGATQHGTSWTSLAPGATTVVKIRAGMFDVIAASARRRVDARSSETPQATTSLELRADLRLVFHDVDQPPPGVDQRGTLGVTFMISEPDPEPAPDSESTPDAPDTSNDAPAAP